MAFYRVSLKETIDRIAESVEQDQTARMCRLILNALHSPPQNKTVVAKNGIRVNIFPLLSNETFYSQPDESN